jgi:biopolymer transport protein ExbB
MGNLGELFGVVRQVAGDTRGNIDESMVSAQLPGRGEFFGDLGERRQLPTVTELSRMWLEMVREIYQSGRVVKFNADVINADGILEENREVVRIGVFNVISDGRFLQWDGNQGLLIELPRQPAGRFQSMAQSLQNASPGQVEDMAIDGTRGAILAQVVRAPDLRERIRQGQTVGYIIIALGVFGVLFSIWKGIVLFLRGGAISRQLKREEASDGNALGRVMKVYQDNPDQDVETLELKLDEAILRETAPLESGLPLIKVLYVVAPLVGLLGTVVGMIVTFQQITLFGTGDPRMMASGISMALITTVLGLVVAIPLTIIHSLLHSRARALIQILEEQAAGIIARLAEHRHGRAD